jgi:hypothetical protein
LGYVAVIEDEWDGEISGWRTYSNWLRAFSSSLVSENSSTSSRKRRDM